MRPTNPQRTWKYRIVTTLERVNNRLTRWALRRGVAPRVYALLETTGRRTGLPRHTPVGNGLDGVFDNDLDGGLDGAADQGR